MRTQPLASQSSNTDRSNMAIQQSIYDRQEALGTVADFVCGTTVHYNGIWLMDCQVNAWDESIEYDQSGTDRIYNKLHIAVTTYVHKQTITQFTGGGFQNVIRGVGTVPWINSSGVEPTTPFTGSPALADADVVEAYIRGRLLEPRGHLVVFLTEADQAINSASLTPYVNVRGLVRSTQIYGSQTQIGSGFNPELWDVNNGPKPSHVKVTYIAGLKSYRIEFAINAFRKICNPDGIYPDGDDAGTDNNSLADNQDVLNHRWGTTEERDSNFMVKRTTTGKLRIRSYTSHPNLFRYLTLPSTPRGYKRTSMRFRQTEDGLGLEYTIVDEQQYAAPPHPAIDWNASVKENVEGYGHVGFVNINVRLRGATPTLKWKLFCAAIKVIDERLGGADYLRQIRANAATFRQQIIPISFTVVDQLDKPEIEVSVVCKRVWGSVEDPSATGAERYANMIIGNLGWLPPVHVLDLDSTPSDPDDFDRVQPLVAGTVGANEEISIHNRDSWPDPFPYDTPAGAFAMYLQDICQTEKGPATESFTDPTTLANSGIIENAADYPGPNVAWGDNISTTGVFVWLDEQFGTEGCQRDATESEAAGGLGFLPDADREAGILSETYTSDHWSEGHKLYAYMWYDISSTYTNNRNLQALPKAVASQDVFASEADNSDSDPLPTTQPVAIVRVAGDITYHILVVRASRINAHPEIPEADASYYYGISPSENAPTAYLLNFEFTGFAPERLANPEQVLFTAEATYTFVLDQPLSKNLELRYGTQPLQVGDASTYRLTINSIENSQIA